MSAAGNYVVDQTQVPPPLLSPQESEDASLFQAQQGNHSPQPAGTQTQRQRRHLGWEANSHDALLVVTTLITTLTYQVGTNPPGGFWQDDKSGHEAGAPIMRDKHRRRYWLFMTASWVGFGNSMLLTMWLLTGAPVSSRRVRWSFAISYSSLQLTYITSMHGTSLFMDIATWAGVMLILFLATRIRRHTDNEVDFCKRVWDKVRQVYEPIRGRSRAHQQTDVELESK